MLPRGCDSGLKTVQHINSRMANLDQDAIDGYQGLLTIPNVLLRDYDLAGNFGPYPETFQAMWDSFPKAPTGELTPTLAASGAAKEFLDRVYGSTPSMITFLFEVADVDSSGGISQAELRDIIHASWELPQQQESGNDYKPMYCWIGLWTGATKFQPPPHC